MFHDKPMYHDKVVTYASVYRLGSGGGGGGSLSLDAVPDARESP